MTLQCDALDRVHDVGGMPTLLLSRTQVERLLEPSTLVTQLRAGFITYSNSSAGRALRVRAPIPDHRGTATVLFPGMLPGLGIYTVKVHAKFPDHDPAIRGVICLHDAGTGMLLAITVLQPLVVLLCRRKAVLRRICRDIRLRGWLKIWLYFHIPVTLALLFALALHILSTFAYW